MIDERFSCVVDEMRRQVESGLRPSIQIAVDWRGKCVLDTAVGAGATEKSHYLLWSTTKPFVALALLGLIEQGKLALDDRVAKVIPEFGKAGKQTATIAHLLTHRGGFPDNTPELQRELAPLRPDWNAALRYVYDMPAAWKPGTERGYHPSTAWFVLGEIVQRIDGRPLPDAVRARVLDPAGVAQDAFSLGEPQRLASPPLQVQTNGARGAPTQGEADYWSAPETQGAVIPGAGGISRAREVVRVFRALLDGGKGPNGRIVAPETVRLATFPHAAGSVDRTFLRDIPWGLGFHLKHVIPSLDDCGVTATPGTFGHGGHFLVNTAWADPGKNLAVCILSNGLAPPREGLAAVGRLSQAVHDVVDAEAAAA